MRRAFRRHEGASPTTVRRTARRLDGKSHPLVAPSRPSIRKS
jgi:hypothetical protein